MNTQRPPAPSAVMPARLGTRSVSLADETRAILRAFHVAPKEQLGQNFLVDPEVLSSIVRIAALNPDTQVLEIGPGIGTLTLALAETGAQIQALDLDPTMAHITRSRTAMMPNVTVHEGNVLHADLAEILDVRRSFVVVANIPYYITAPILRLFLEGSYRPDELILMVQREVGERLAATPGKMSALAVYTQIQASIDIARLVSATSFLPRPAVDSAVIKLRRREPPAVPLDEQPFLFHVVKAGFSKKRKMIHNSLDSGLPHTSTTIDAALTTAHVARTRRAETLSVEEWRQLALALRADTRNLPRAMRGMSSIQNKDGGGS